MPHFGTQSRKNLDTCTPIVRAINNKAIKVYDYSVLCGYRGKIAQEAAFAAGKSRARWGKSEHNIFPSNAWDVAPYFAEKPHIRWDRKEEFIFLAGLLIGIGAELGFEIKWGGNWDQDQEILTDQSFDDLPHLVVVGPL
jgi:peptidoglycan L-alanyl-D-glutamate endopeptidase CwlK